MRVRLVCFTISKDINVWSEVRQGECAKGYNQRGDGVGAGRRVQGPLQKDVGILPCIQSEKEETVSFKSLDKDLIGVLSR